MLPAMSPSCQTALRKQVDDAEPQPAEPPRPSVDAEPSDYEDDDGPGAELRAHFPASFGGARWPALGPGRDMRLPSPPACPCSRVNIEPRALGRCAGGVAETAAGGGAQPHRPPRPAAHGPPRPAAHGPPRPVSRAVPSGEAPAAEASDGEPSAGPSAPVNGPQADADGGHGLGEADEVADPYRLPVSSEAVLEGTLRLPGIVLVS